MTVKSTGTPTTGVTREGDLEAGNTSHGNRKIEHGNDPAMSRLIASILWSFTSCSTMLAGCFLPEDAPEFVKVALPVGGMVGLVAGVAAMAVYAPTRAS